MKEKRVTYHKPEKLMILSPAYGSENFILAYVKMGRRYDTYTNYRISKIIKMPSNYIFYEKSGRISKKIPGGEVILPFLSDRYEDIIEVNKLPDNDVVLYYEMNNLGRDTNDL